MAQIIGKAGNYGYRVFFEDNQGKRHSTQKSGFKRKSDALEAARLIETKKSRNQLTASETATFSDYFNDWINTYRIGRRDETTENKYINAGRVIQKYFGNTLLKDVSKMEYQKMLDEYGTTHVRDTVSSLNSFVRAVVQDAIDEGIIYRNFTNKVEITSTVQPTSKIKFLEEDQARKLLQYCYDSCGIFSITKCEIALALTTGLRYAEIVGLTHDNIDFENLKITVNKTYDYKHHSGFKPTKTPSSMRTIDVDPETIKMLKQLKLEQQKCFLRQGFVNKENLVFINNKHTVPTNTAGNKALKKALNNCGINSNITFHNLRHTHASMLIANNVSIEYVAERLGHSNTAITAKVYVHLLQKRRESEVKKTLNLFSNVNL